MVDIDFADDYEDYLISNFKKLIELTIRYRFKFDLYQYSLLLLVEKKFGEISRPFKL